MRNALAKSVFIILLASSCAAAQSESCDLSSRRAPLLLGLQIGGSPEDARLALASGGAKIKIKKNGERVFFQNYINKPGRGVLSGVRALYLRFYDRRLYQIEIFYEPRSDWQNIGQITNALAAQFDFAAENQSIFAAKTEIKCGQITLVADNVLNPRIELTDETLRAEVQEARRKVESK